MFRIHSPIEVPFDAIARVAIAIKQFGPNWQHVGILVRAEGSDIALVHLPTHGEFSREVPDYSYHWIPSTLDDRLLFSLAEWIAVLWERNQEKGLLPYSIEYCGRYFSATGEYQRSEIGEGLTCATFVIAVLGDFGIPILDPKTWAKRLSDSRWQKRILETMAERGASKEHIEKQKASIGVASRYKPEEVGGAFGIYRDRAVTYKEVLPIAEAILSAIKLPDKNAKN